MTIAEQTPRSGPYNGDGSTVAFAYGFQIDAASELVVQVQDASGDVTTKTLTTDYTVSGVGNAAGGTVTFVTAPVSGETIAITRDIPITQEVDLQNRGVVQPEVLEELFDDFTRILQTLDEEVSRAIKVDVFDTSDIDQLLIDINVLSGISGDISTVAGIDADVTTVAGDSADIQTLAGLNAEIGTLAGLSTEIAALDAISADITTVAHLEDGTTATAAISGLAALSAEIVALDGLSTEIAALDAISADITTVAGDSADIQTLADISADIQTLASGTGGTLTGNWEASGVWDFTGNEALRIPVGTTAQRPATPAQGDIRRNTTTGAWEGYDGSGWGNLGGAGLFKGENGTTGDAVLGAGDIFRVHEQTLNTDTTIDADENAVAAGPLAVASGVTLTVTSGGNLAIV